MSIHLTKVSFLRPTLLQMPIRTLQNRKYLSFEMDPYRGNVNKEFAIRFTVQNRSKRGELIKEKIFRALEYPKAMDCLRDIDKFLEDWNKTSFIHKEHSIFNAFFGMPKVLLKKIFSQSSQKTE